MTYDKEIDENKDYFVNVLQTLKLENKIIHNRSL